MRALTKTMGRVLIAGIIGAIALGSIAIAPAMAQVEIKSFSIWTSRDSQQGGLPLIAARKGFFTEGGTSTSTSGS